MSVLPSPRSHGVICQRRNVNTRLGHSRACVLFTRGRPALGQTSQVSLTFWSVVVVKSLNTEVRRLRFLEGSPPTNSIRFCWPSWFRSSASCSHFSSTGFSFWALLGVMSSFSNLWVTQAQEGTVTVSYSPPQG